MSRVTRRKHIMNEALWADWQLPERNHYIVKVLKTMGNNLHKVTTPGGEIYLVSMPIKFRRVIWVKRGDYILVEPIHEGNKVKAEIVKILNKESIQYYKESNVWPEEFEDSINLKHENNERDLVHLFDNMNTNGVQCHSETSGESSDSDQTSEEENYSSEY